MSERKPIRHFSMIRSFHLADIFTVANGFCGVVAIFEAMKFLSTGRIRHIYLGALLIPVALVFDVLDGSIARSRHAASSLGRELDSLADLISFGVAPAAIAFAIGVNSRLDQLILIYFALCGLARLARYNVTAEALSAESGKVPYYEGTPIPASIIPLGVLMYLFFKGHIYPVHWLGIKFHIPVLLFFLSGCLMISKTVKIPKP